MNAQRYEEIHRELNPGSDPKHPMNQPPAAGQAAHTRKIPLAQAQETVRQLGSDKAKLSHEVARLLSVNAALVEALETLTKRLDPASKDFSSQDEAALKQARAALAQAKE